MKPDTSHSRALECRAGGEVIVPGQLEQARVKLNRGAAPIQHGTA